MAAVELQVQVILNAVHVFHRVIVKWICEIIDAIICYKKLLLFRNTGELCERANVNTKQQRKRQQNCFGVGICR